ncbi:MAG: hypothetical protein AAGF81_18070 [Pseudomonadota bacterium]
MRILFCIFVTLSLSGCMHQLGGEGGLAPGAGCPPLKHYSRAQQNRLDTELKSCGAACGALAGALSDYHVLRRQIRACRRRR